MSKSKATAIGFVAILLWALLALFTALIWLMYGRTGRPFAAHAVFTLHWSAFYLLMEGARRLLPFPGLGLVLVLLCLVYLIVAMRAVYKQGWVLSAGKAVLSLFLFYALIASWMASALALAVRFA